MFDPFGFASMFLSLGERCSVDIGTQCGCWCADGSMVNVTYSSGSQHFPCPEPETDN